MDTSDLLAMVRLQCLIEPTNVDYTDAVLLRELNNSLTTKFERMVLDAHANYWIQSIDLSTVAGNQEYRLPSRAIGVSKIELGYASAATTGFIRLPQCSEDHINIFQTAAGGRDTPERFVMRGDRVFLDPPPSDSGFILRIWYYIRPSRLVPAQIFVAGTATPYGVITAINTATRAVTTNAIPSYYPIAASSALPSPFPCDIIGAGGWRELQVVGENATVAGNVVTFTNTAIDLSSVQLGDVVRYADQTDWPQLPEDFHRCLADVSSIKVLIQRDYQQKAGGYAQDASADIQRFQMLIATRVQEEPTKLRAFLPSLRSGRYWGGYR